MRAAGALWLLLLSPLVAAGAEIVITTDALTPAVLTVAADEPVVFLNRSSRIVHVDFLGRTGEHQVLQVPGSIRAIFHRPGRHPYVVHFEEPRRGELRGVVEVEEARDPRVELPVCRGISVEGNCVEPP
jgi:hypothetical protein